MTYDFNHIVLMAKKRNKATIDTLTAVYDLLTKLNIDTHIDVTTARLLDLKKFPTINANEFKDNIDLAIAIGGDGSLLHAARTVVHQNVPILGVNRGRLGFLTDINPDNLDQITDVLSGQYTKEKRFLLYAHVQHDESTICKADALNDVVLLPDAIAHMIDFDIFIDNKCMCNLRADGLIIATPTGSTAYALSGGGPILHPELDSVVLVPMFPHSLTYRPIVIDANSEIKVVVSNLNNGISPAISCDGQPSIPLQTGDIIKIIKNRNYLNVIHPNTYNYYDALRSKLHWAKKLGQD